MFIDVHCHLDYYSDKEIEQIITRAKKNKIKIIVTNGTDSESNKKSLELSKKYPEVKSAMGIYPIKSISLSEAEIKKEIELMKLNSENISAIGEVGLDLKETAELEKQAKVFQQLIYLSMKLDKPIIVHSRKAEKECIELLEKSGAKKVIMHCFCGNMNLVEKIIGNKWFFSIPASIKNLHHFQNVVDKTPITQLLCETDSPFLHPFKERNNEPSFVIESYKKIAEIKKLPLKEVEKQIEENYKKIFT